MTKRSHVITEYWYLSLPAALLILQAAVFLVFRENSYFQVHDNLDLFMAHYEMIKKEHAFFAQGYSLPMLGGIDRDLLGSEWNLYNLMYILLPGFWAYLVGYALKIVIGIVSFSLLAKEYLKERYEWCKPLVALCACAYALIPVFPTYGIAFTSIPLIVYYLIRLHRVTGKAAQVKYYVLIFCYPFLSYFAYHGFFILCYMALGIIILLIMKRKFPLRLFIATALLSVGSMVFEYRLFRAMLFDDTVTIRTTMEHGHLTLSQALSEAVREFRIASFHSQDTHTHFILPVVLIGFLVINFGYVKRGEIRRMLTEPVNGILLWIVLNCVNFGLYFYAPYRETVERLVPKLTGFEFSRTSYFNPFLWYAAFFLILVRMYDTARFHIADGSARKRVHVLAGLMGVVALLLVMFVPQMYNDFYDTCYNHAYRILKRKETSTVNYREFYSAALFDAVKQGIDYKNGEYSCAYGFHPSILNYNGIATLDGYLGMYPEEYKQRWTKVVAPAIATSPSLADYFTSWGARVWLMSPADENTYAPLRNLELTDERLVADMDALADMHCTYIFSRIRFSNEAELPLTFVEAFSGYGSPYTIYVYQMEAAL